MSFIFHYVVQMIYLAIEIARNLEGINDRSKEAYTKDHKDEEAKEVRWSIPVVKHKFTF